MNDVKKEELKQRFLVLYPKNGYIIDYKSIEIKQKEFIIKSIGFEV